MPVNLNGMDPRVLSALKKIQADAAARGIETNVISGVRSLDDQKQLYANWLAGQNHQPLPFPDRGAVPLAATPGTSEHEKGLAFDLQASDPSRQNELWGLAPSAGLRVLGSRDPNHFELAGSQPSRPVSPTPGASYESPLDLVARLESGNTNVSQKIHDINTDRGTPAQGYFQIIDPTWRAHAKAAGVDINRYPSAITAPRDVQIAVASAIPINQWGPNTVAALKKQYPNLDTSQTLGALQSKAGGGTAVANAGGGDDWQSLLGVPNDPGEIGGLGSMLSDAVSPGPSRAPSSALSPIEPEPQIDQPFALATPTTQELGARYEQGKATRKLSPLGQLFSLPVIGPQIKPAAGPPPYTNSNLGVG